MPILVRPVREQIEHDRVIRQLESKWRRKFKVDANPGDERHASVTVGTLQLFPDLVLTTEGGKKPSAVIEVETGESVNHLEAMSQWASFAKSRIPFYLFVPGSSLDAARRLCNDHQIDLTELWTYLVLGDQIRFTSVFRAPSAAAEPVAEVEATEKVEKAEKPEKEKRAPAPAPAARKTPARPAEPAREPAAAAAAPAPVAASHSNKTGAAAPRAARKTAAPAAPPRRKVSAPAKRAAAAKRPARGAVKRAPVRRAAAKARPAPAKRTAQKRK